METKEYFEKVMHDFNQNRRGRNLRKYFHYDLNRYVIYQKWFDDGKMLKPKFMEIKSCHLITREQVTLLVSNAVQSKMYIYDE